MQEQPNDHKILKGLSPSKVIIPVVIGLGVTGYMLYRDIANNDLLSHLKNPNIFWIVMAFVALLIRDGFYIYRIRHLTKKALSWVGSFYIIILWEFSSAISPSAVGGTAVAAFLLMKEGISFGKSLAYVLVSAILDNFFFISVGAIVLLLNLFNVFPNGIFYLEGVAPELTATLRYTFYVSYSVIFIYNLLMVYGLFARPEAIRWLFIRITSFKLLRRFRKAAEHQGEELMVASAELKGIKSSYWIKAILSTALIWIARYFIVNCLVAAFFTLTFGDHTLIFSRHVILWVVLIIAITPGASGIAEYAFKGFYMPFAGVMTGIIAIVWRLMTYYPYLILGAVFLPRWISRVFFETKKDQQVVAKSES